MRSQPTPPSSANRWEGPGTAADMMRAHRNTDERDVSEWLPIILAVMRMEMMKSHPGNRHLHGGGRIQKTRSLQLPRERTCSTGRQRRWVKTIRR